MPDLDFEITGAGAAAEGLTPLIQFELSITNKTAAHGIHAVLLHTQIQISSPQRRYNAQEKDKLIELFGRPEQWAQTLRNRLWAATDTVIGAFAETAETRISIPCSFDVSIAATKYFYALEEGDVPLLFLFSGTIFYAAQDGRLQAQPISWNKEATFRMPCKLWEKMMDEHFPNSAWIYLRRDTFDRLYALKRDNGDATWEQTIERLLPETTSLMA